MKNKKIKVGLVGCGTIGSAIAEAVDKGFKNRASLVAISDCDAGKAAFLRRRLKKKPAIVAIDKLIKSSDLVIEAASAKISGQVAKKALLRKKDVIIMSVGGVVKNHAALFNLARKAQCKIYLPSGAICGLDGVKSASVGKIYKAELTTRKRPAALAGAPFIEKNKIDLTKIKSEKVIFNGSAEEAIAGFPKNINVSCALSLAGIGPQRTKVRIIVSPNYTKNIHEIEVEGEFGKLITKTENVPSPYNPKTSHLAVLSAIKTLRQALDPVKIGT
ncbi:MAG: aspartate dehydrogenase [Candidatus Omnitrophica bacterium]|nr:aspartate dehydrogenase [Candidatus Omnitrophota bacterium]